jgi:hypothetical protein
VKEGKVSATFFEKKVAKKLLLYWCGGFGRWQSKRHTPVYKKFFAAFFQKSSACFAGAL